MAEALHQKTAIITGASRGIGAATAEYFAAQGAQVVLAARSGDAITQIANDITKKGGRAIAQVCDVGSWSDVAALFDTARDAFGGVDIVVNNAGLIEPIARIDESDPESWGQVVDVNLKGVYYCIRAALPDMIAARTGTIINISSGAAYNALEGWSHYCATKAGVLSLTKSVHKEYGAMGLRSIGLSPGTVATEMQHQIKASGVNPVSQMSFSDHIPARWVAEAIAYLCGPGGTPYLGQDFSLKTNEGRLAVGLPPVQ